MCSVVLPVPGSLALFHVVHAAVNLEDCMFYCTSPLPQCLVVWHQSADDGESCPFSHGHFRLFQLTMFVLLHSVLGSLAALLLPMTVCLPERFEPFLIVFDPGSGHYRLVRYSFRIFFFAHPRSCFGEEHWHSP